MKWNAIQEIDVAYRDFAWTFSTLGKLYLLEIDRVVGSEPALSTRLVEMNYVN